jgi:hypothetical protein
MSTTGRYICESCGWRSDAPGDCREHADEPLQDLASEDVCIMLDDFDGARKRKRYGLLGVVAIVLTSPLVVLVPLRKIAVMAWFLAAGGVTGVLFRFFPSRKVLPDLAAEKPAWFTA